jgi:hypothetical protein
MAWPRHATPPETEAAARGGAVEPQVAEVAAGGALVDPKSSFWGDTAFLWALTLFCLLLYFATASAHEFYIDDVYLIQTTKHSPTGSADLFPLPIWLLWLSTEVLGWTPFAVRLFPAIAGSANILAAGLLARELGGGRFAVSLTGLGVFVAPFFLFVRSSAMDWTYESLLWSLSALLIVRILRTGDRRLWWLVGMVWGAGMLNKPTVLLFMWAVGFGLLLTQARVELLKRGYWLALAVAIAVFSPAVLWQTVHGWPFLRMMAAMRSDEFAESGFWLAYFSRSKMLLAQPAYLGPLNFVLACAGLFHSLVPGKESPCRAVLWAAAAAGLAFVATSGFTFYMNPIYSILLAFGCVAAARIAAGRRAHWMRPTLAAGLMVQGLVLAPLCLPLLPQDSLGAYSRIVGRGMLAPLSSTASILEDSEKSVAGANTFAYRSWAAKFYLACRMLPASERGNCCIILGYAPVAAATEFYGAQYHLPEILSPHLNYSIWGPPEEGTNPVIAAFFTRKELEGWFGRVENANNSCDIYICRFPKRTYKEIWQEMCSKDSSFRWRAEG